MRTCMRLLCRVTLAGLIGLVVAGIAHAENTADAAALKARFETMGEQLRSSPFGRPVVLESAERPDALVGDIYAVLEHPFARVSAALDDAPAWCDVLMLHLNVKRCTVAGRGPTSTVAIRLGRKHDQSVTDAYRLEFAYGVSASTSDYLQVQMSAASGPLGTRDYRIAFDAMPLPDGRSFVHLTYSYGYGLAARVAMLGYLSTLGRSKVGFSNAPGASAEAPRPVAGVRGLIERNTMRYYLAIAAYLDAASLPEPQRLERRLHDWFEATERYPRQLHEMDEAAYLEMKRAELKDNPRAPAVLPPEGALSPLGAARR